MKHTRGATGKLFVGIDGSLSGLAVEQIAAPDGTGGSADGRERDDDVYVCGGGIHGGWRYGRGSDGVDDDGQFPV